MILYNISLVIYIIYCIITNLQHTHRRLERQEREGARMSATASHEHAAGGQVYDLERVGAGGGGGSMSLNRGNSDTRHGGGETRHDARHGNSADRGELGVVRERQDRQEWEGRQDGERERGDEGGGREGSTGRVKEGEAVTLGTRRKGLSWSQSLSPSDYERGSRDRDSLSSPASAAERRKRVKVAGGGTVGGVGRSGHAGAGDQATSHDRIRVCVRKRPLSEKELARDNKDIIRCNPVTGNYFSRVVYAVPVTSLLVTLSSAFT
jgi:hypothetical protein